LTMLELLMHNECMNKLTIQKRSLIVGCLVEGNSLRSTARMADVSLVTVLKLLHDMGDVCRP